MLGPNGHHRKEGGLMMARRQRAPVHAPTESARCSPGLAKRRQKKRMHGSDVWSPIASLNVRKSMPYNARNYCYEIKRAPIQMTITFCCQGQVPVIPQATAYNAGCPGGCSTAPPHSKQPGLVKTGRFVFPGLFVYILLPLKGTRQTFWSY